MARSLELCPHAQLIASSSSCYSPSEIFRVYSTMDGSYPNRPPQRDGSRRCLLLSPGLRVARKIWYTMKEKNSVTALIE